MTSPQQTRPAGLSAFTRGLSGTAKALLVGAGLLMGGALAGGISGVGDAPLKAQGAGSFTPAQKQEIGEIVKDYLLQNPEVLLEVQAELEKRMQEMQTARLKDAVKSNAQSLFRRPDAPIAGNPNGDITVVEFFDYNCHFCKKGFTAISDLIKSDKNVKVVLKEFPIFGKGSEGAARAALAAKKQGKYWELHSALLQAQGRVDGASAIKTAKKLGLDIDKLKADMQSDAVNQEISEVRELAQKLGINGTPHFLVGDRSIAGAPEDLLNVFKTNVAEMRENGGCDVC